MEVSVVQQEAVTVFVVQGSIDTLTADQLSRALAQQIDAGRCKLVADLSAVTYTSSAGLRSLLIALKSSRKGGGDFRIAAPQPGVMSVLSMSGFSNLIKVFDSVADAVSSYGG